MLSDQAASVFSWAARNSGMAASVPSGTTENQPETDNATPFASSQIELGEKPRPVMRYSVSSPFEVLTFPAASIVASPAGRSGSLWFGAFKRARASTPENSGGEFIGR